MDKFFIHLDKYGNTSAASIPIALSEMSDQGLLQRGDKNYCSRFWWRPYMGWSLNRMVKLNKKIYYKN